VAGVTEEVEGLDEEFLFHLDRGAGLLGRGEVGAARESLERALGLRPRDPKVLGLLGQAFYRQGMFEQAAVAWQRLVDDNPVEPGARVNLGLACLKSRRFLDAVRQLEIALDLNPDHKKAMGYLGLALLEAGDAARARGWFAKAGSDQMVARCDELLAGQAGAAAAAPPPVPEPVQALSPLLTSGAEPAPEAPPDPAAAPGAEPAPEVVTLEEEPAPLAWADPAGAPVPAVVAQAGPAAAPSPSASGPSSAPTLAAYAAARVVEAGPEPFSVSAGGLAVAVKGELLCRLTGLAAWRGEVAFAGEVKRFRGRATDKPFGEGADRMHRLTGEGLVVLRPAGHRFAVLDLGDESGYFREAVVFAFEEPVAFENGRLAAAGGDLDLVHLRGHGRVVLRTGGEPVAVDVRPGAPVRVPVASLVGWTGGVAPRLAPLAGAEGGGGAVELTGEGRVLVDPGGAGA